jgi:hypothetical protein
VSEAHETAVSASDGAAGGSGEPFRCGSSARDRADPQLGSAPQFRRWLLIEHRGPWQVDALAGSQISPPVLTQLLSTARAQNARPLLIRRPGRSDPAAPRSWAVAYENGAVRWGTWREDDELLAADVAMTGDAPPPGGATDQVLLVCAHGVHDVCCALRGRPVAAALAREWPEATWECSHVGGDRFSANLVVLPDGVYYGYLDAETAVATVRSHLRGEVVVEYLRGMTRAAPPAQAAIAAVHQRLGPFGARDVVVAQLDHTSPGVWHVTLTVPDPLAGPITVKVTSRRRAPAQLTCRAAGETPAAEYHVVGFDDGIHA